MPIPVEQARRIITDFEGQDVANLFAQAQAKRVLREVGENAANFPRFDAQLDDKVTFAAYSLLAAGCSLAEQQDRVRGASALEKAASLIESIHGADSLESRESGFHILLAAMAFYTAGQYSRAFVAMRRAQENTEPARIVGAFLRKDFEGLNRHLSGVLLRTTPEFADHTDLEEWAITVAIARAVALAGEFLFTGSVDLITLADRQLDDAGIVAWTGRHAAWWWIIRLLRLMLADLRGASLWTVLPPFFGPESQEILNKYIRLAAFGGKPVVELWQPQRDALSLAMDAANRGCVINLPTSAGKTRIAELAILKALLSANDARVFYLAPFRSLAIEVERTLSASFSWLGYGVSHLYGGSRVSSIDTELAAESPITIATPEKLRALFRAAPDLFQNLKLVIVDEGHLLGPDKRHVPNEVFLDHLRHVVANSGSRLLLLSAVLPNASELAQWVTGTPEAVVKSAWRPSAERFGLLRWNGTKVRIDWKGEFESFNPSFVEAGPLGFGHRRKAFPADKNEAIAASAVRLSAVGPVMIFTARARSVPGLAKAVLLALGQTPSPHPWPEQEWKVFEAVCNEELEPDAVELRAARAGVICHSNRLAPQLRLATEHLMRAGVPKIIIATTTLAQGVNLGVSSVIVATPYVDKTPIDKRDFWNICGRAGRAFVDAEGKILFAIDDTLERWQVQKAEALATDYFNRETTDPVRSGLLFVVDLMRSIAARAQVSFDVLLELAANNDFARFGDKAETCELICDLIDDELLAMHLDPGVNGAAADPEAWVEEVFRASLAVLQAHHPNASTTPEQVLRFLQARVRSVLHRVPEDARAAIVSGGLPLSVAIREHLDLDLFRRLADRLEEANTLEARVAGLREVEDWARNHARFQKKIPEAAELDGIRAGWLSGVSLRELGQTTKVAASVCRDIYGYLLPWIVHSASQQLRSLGERDRADALAELALVVEVGVPSDRAARVFLAGVRSRAAAAELGATNVDLGDSVSAIGRTLRNPQFREGIRPQVSEGTNAWLDLISAETRAGARVVPRFEPFELQGLEGVMTAHVRRLDQHLFLTTVDGRIRTEVRATAESPFAAIADDPRVAFTRTNETWNLVVRDPRAEPVVEPA